MHILLNSYPRTLQYATHAFHREYLLPGLEGMQALFCTGTESD